MPPEHKTFVETISELWELLLAYAKQETVTPIKNIGRFVAFGAAAMFLWGFAFVLFSLAGLRFMQEKTDGHLSGNWNWVPYLVSLVILLAGMGIAALKIKPKRHVEPTRQINTTSQITTRRSP